MTKKDEKDQGLFEAMNGLDDKFIDEFEQSVRDGYTMTGMEDEEGAQTTQGNENVVSLAEEKKKKGISWRKVIVRASAACAVIAGIFLAGSLLQSRDKDSSTSKELAGDAASSTSSASGMIISTEKAGGAEKSEGTEKSKEAEKTEEPKNAEEAEKSDGSKTKDAAKEVPASPIEAPDAEIILPGRMDATGEKEGMVLPEAPDVYEPLPAGPLPSEPVINGDPIIDEPIEKQMGTAELLTCGRWNDRANWGFFFNLVRSQIITFPAYGLNPVNTIRVNVKNSEGQALAGWTVEAVSSQDPDAARVLWKAATNVSGWAWMFTEEANTPLYVNVYDPDGRLRYSGNWDSEEKAETENKETQAVSSGDGSQEISVTNAELNIVIPDEAVSKPLSEKTEVMFIVDTTGSMDDEMLYLQADFAKIMADVSLENVAYSLNFYRDRGDEYVTKTFPFERDLSVLQSTLNQNYADGGGDYPEAVAEILQETMNSENWSEDSVKIAFLIFDAPPHDGREDSLKLSIRTAAQRGIHLIPVIASGSDRDTELFGRAMAIMTDGEYVFLTDDSGIGGSHLEPIIGDHEIEKLHDVIVDLIEGYGKGKR